MHFTSILSVPPLNWSNVSFLQWCTHVDMTWPWERGHHSMGTIATKYNHQPYTSTRLVPVQELLFYKQEMDNAIERVHNMKVDLSQRAQTTLPTYFHVIRKRFDPSLFDLGGVSIRYTINPLPDRLRPVIKDVSHNATGKTAQPISAERHPR